MGQPLGFSSASQLATMLKRDFDGVSKHLRVMRTAGMVRLDLRAPAVVAEAPLAVQA